MKRYSEGKDYKYKAKVGNRWLKNQSLVRSRVASDTFESKTEPIQRLNQMKKDGKLNKNAKITVVAESTDKSMKICESGLYWNRFIKRKVKDIDELYVGADFSDVNGTGGKITDLLYLRNGEVKVTIFDEWATYSDKTQESFWSNERLKKGYGMYFSYGVPEKMPKEADIDTPIGALLALCIAKNASDVKDLYGSSYVDDLYGEVYDACKGKKETSWEELAQSSGSFLKRSVRYTIEYCLEQNKGQLTKSQQKFMKLCKKIISDIDSVLGTSKLGESRRDRSILRSFKKGYDALVDALETQLPTSWGFVTNCRFRRGSEDFNGDCIIEMSFETLNASNICYYIDGDVKRVKMTTYFNHEKAIANLINETVDFDDVYVMEGPSGETSLYITNATPANEQPLKEARVPVPKEEFEFSDILRETWYILKEHGFSPKKKEERTMDEPTAGQILVVKNPETKMLEVSLTGEYEDDIIISQQWHFGKTQVEILATGFQEDMAWRCLSVDEFSHDFDECLSECMRIINK